MTVCGAELRLRLKSRSIKQHGVRGIIIDSCEERFEREKLRVHEWVLPIANDQRTKLEFDTACGTIAPYSHEHDGMRKS
jgi:hypothetical protein